MNTQLRSLPLLLLLLASTVRAEAPVAHVESDCNACHRLGVRQPEAVAAIRTAACGSCHGASSERPWRTTAFHTSADRACTDCHSFHAPDEVRLPGMSEGQTASLAKMPAGTTDLDQCKPCHQTGGPSPTLLHPGHQAASNWYHANVALVASQSVSESCLRCHDRDQDLPAELGPEWNPPRPARSANHPFGVSVRANRRGGFGIRQTLDPRLELVNGRIECTTCHDLYETSDDMLVAFDTRAQLCTGCHERTTSPDTGPSSLALSR